MKNWVEGICNDPSNFVIVINAYEFYANEYEKIRKQIDVENVRGARVQDLALRMPSLADDVHARWSEVKAIADHLDILIMSATQKARKHYIENYNRTLTSYQVRDYAEADDVVIEIRQLALRINLIMNKWEGLSKGLERLHYQIRNIIELRKAGFEDLVIT